MRLAFPDGGRTVLTYCTNVHAIEAPADLLDALFRYCRPVRDRIGTPLLSLGLWISRRASRALASEPAERRRLVEALAANGLEIVTLNGFPYGDFHAERVKEDVYRPDWADVRRYEYTLELATLLEELLPSDIPEGTISTLPLGYVPGGDEAVVEECALRLAHLAVDLDRLAQRRGRPIRVCLEPEPGCLLETTPQAIGFFAEHLRPAARRRGVSDEVLDRHLGLCFDACHQAVAFEDAAASWEAIAAAGIVVGKVQLSCALEASSGSSELLRPFDEPRFLHQVRRRDARGRIDRWMDLLPALESLSAGESEVRVHFHVPLDWRPTGALRTTAGSLADLAGRIAATRPLPHLEVETYTWTVLPEDIRPRDDASLIEGIARELRFAEEALAVHGGARVKV